MNINIINFSVPSRVRDVQEHCTVIVWKAPAETNGQITNYLLTFQREEQIVDVLADPTYHYHVIQPNDIPPGGGPVTVEVCIAICGSLLLHCI